jgi:hypothetical protein
MDESSRIRDYVLNCKALGELIVWVSDIAQALEMSPALVAEMLEAGGVEVVLDTQRRKCFYSSQVGQDFGHPGAVSQAEQLIRQESGQEKGKPARVELRGKMVRGPDGRFRFANPEGVLRALRTAQGDEQEDRGWEL